MKSIVLYTNKFYFKMAQDNKQYKQTMFTNTNNYQRILADSK